MQGAQKRKKFATPHYYVVKNSFVTPSKNLCYNIYVGNAVGKKFTKPALPICSPTHLARRIHQQRATKTLLFFVILSLLFDFDKYLTNTFGQDSVAIATIMGLLG